MKYITITLTSNEWEYIQKAVEYVSKYKTSFLRNHPEALETKSGKEMQHNAKLYTTLSTFLKVYIKMQTGVKHG